MSDQKILPPGSMTKIVRRLSDGAIFEPSHRDDYNEGHAFIDMLSGRSSFYFRRITRLPLKWWQRRHRYQRTGEIWQPTGGREFEVLDASEEPQ